MQQQSHLRIRRHPSWVGSKSTRGIPCLGPASTVNCFRCSTSQVFFCVAPQKTSPSSRWTSVDLLLVRGQWIFQLFSFRDLCETHYSFSVKPVSSAFDNLSLLPLPPFGRNGFMIFGFAFYKFAWFSHQWYEEDIRFCRFLQKNAQDTSEKRFGVQHVELSDFAVLVSGFLFLWRSGNFISCQLPSTSSV